MIMIMSLFVLPLSAFADESNPMTKIKEEVKIDFGIINGMNFFFTPLGKVISLIVFAGLLFLIGRIIWRIVRVSTGKASLKDKWFWIENGISLLIIFLIINGSFFALLESIFSWTDKQDLVGPTE